MDTPATSAAPGAAPATQPADLLPLARDLQNDIALVTAVVQAVKAQGALAGITSQAPAIVAAVQKDVKDVEAALPAVKAGFKTSEFWLIAAFLAGNAVYTGTTGKTLPIDINALLGTVLAVYTGFRSQAKKGL